MLQLNCNVLTMMQYVHCLRNVQNQSTAICRQIICVNIEVEYSVTILIITTRHRYGFFCKYNAQNLVWNWYGSMEDCLPFHSWNLPFHSILASSIFHTEIFVPFHFPFHSIPYHALNALQNTTLWSSFGLCLLVRWQNCAAIPKHAAEPWFSKKKTCFSGSRVFFWKKHVF